jgi:hypothetical protein
MIANEYVAISRGGIEIAIEHTLKSMIREFIDDNKKK